jgi:biotin carboxylase
MFLMFDEKTEELAREIALEVCFPPAKLRQYLDDKVVTTRIAEEAGVECVPNVLAAVDSYELEVNETG